MLNVIFRPTASLVCTHFIHLPRWLQTQSWAVAGLCLFIPSAATAQPADLDPLNAHTASLITYQSAFSDYKPYQDPELMPWKTANDVVRQFGGIAGMGSMEGVKGADSPDTKPGEGEPANEPAQPSHDMSNMNTSETPTFGPQKPASPDSKPGEIKNMPGHDMSKMQNSQPKTTAPKVAPTPGMKDKGDMADIPGHDMGSMQQKTSPAPTTKPSPPPGKPAAPATMPGHGGMSH